MNSEVSGHKKPSHTPGPWTVESGHYICSDEGVEGCVLAMVFSGPKSKADENLMAAAPDLLAALIELDEATKCIGGPRIEAASAGARSAIAKATGAA